MSNPGNTFCGYGIVSQEPYFYKRKSDQVEFACSFNLSVRRNYKNREGKYDYDVIPVRYEGEKRMNFAHLINKGDYISISGAGKSEWITTKHGDTALSFYICAESIQFTPLNNKVKISAE